MFLPYLEQILILLSYSHRNPEFDKFKENRDVEIALIHVETRISNKRIDGRTDGHSEVNRQFQRLCEHTQKLCIVYRHVLLMFYWHNHQFPQNNYFIGLYNEKPIVLYVDLLYTI
jgi:hypothetical protein